MRPKYHLNLVEWL